MTEAQERSVPMVTFTDAEAGAKTFPDSTERRFNYFTPAGRKQTHYEDVTVEVQPDPRHYLAQGWLATGCCNRIHIQLRTLGTAGGVPGDRTIHAGEHPTLWRQGSSCGTQLF